MKSVSSDEAVDVPYSRKDRWIGDEPVATPFARRFRVVESLPFSERQLLQRLRNLDASRIEVMRRGSPVDTNALETRLGSQLHGARVFTVALTRVGGGSIAIICERERD